MPRTRSLEVHALPGRVARPRAGQERRRAAESGQSLVEFALVVPVLLTLVFGILEFGLAYSNDIQLTNAVTSGVREFVVDRGQSSPCTLVASTIDASAPNLNASKLAITLTDSNPADSGDTYTSPPSTGTCPTLTSGDTVTVSATYPCTPGFMGVNFLPSCLLSSSSSETVQ